MNKVVVSGANGFLGSNFVKRCALDGIEVYALTLDLDNVNSGIINSNDIKWIEVNDKTAVNIDEYINDRDIDAYYHFAWKGSSGKLRSDYLVQINNILNTCGAVMAAAKLGCKKFVFAESIMEYEIKKAIDLINNVPISTLYSTAKLSSKYMAKALCQNKGIDYVGALISNVYGPGEKSERLINTTIRSLNEGKHCSFSSGEQLYDFVFIDDAVEVLKLIGGNGTANQSYYIGNKKQRKLKDFLTELCDTVFDDELHRELLGFGELPNPTTILNYDEFDTGLVYRQFGYKPRISFKEGIYRTNEAMKGKL